MSNTAAGAMPGPGATPDRLYSFGPGWAAYRLPFAGLSSSTFSRDAGVAFEGEPAPTGGATPPAGGDPPKPAEQPKPPATGAPEPDADGMMTEGGRSALATTRGERDAEREERKRIQKELDDLRAATQSDTEKRDAGLKAAAAQERDAFWSARIRQTEVRSTLRAAGLTNEKTLALAVRAAEFEALKVEEDGSVKGLDAAVEAFKKDNPEMFAVAPKPTPGQPTRGPQNGGAPDRPKSLAEAVTQHYAGGTAG